MRKKNNKGAARHCSFSFDLRMDVVSGHPENTVGQRLFRIGLTQNAAADQFLRHISDDLIGVHAHPLVDLSLQTCRNKTEEAFAHRCDPLGQQIIRCCIFGEQADKIPKLLRGEAGEIQAIAVVRFLQEMNRKQMCCILVGENVFGEDSVRRGFQNPVLTQPPQSPATVNILIEIFADPVSVSVGDRSCGVFFIAHGRIAACIVFVGPLPFIRCLFD